MKTPVYVVDETINDEIRIADANHRIVCVVMVTRGSMWIARSIVELFNRRPWWRLW